MSSYVKPLIATFKANSDLSSYKNCFVKMIDASTVEVAGAGERAVGILMNDPKIGQAAEVALPGGGALLKVAAAYAVGKVMKSASGGVGTVATAAGDWIAAELVEASTNASDIVSVLVIAGFAQASDA